MQTLTNTTHYYLLILRRLEKARKETDRRGADRQGEGEEQKDAEDKGRKGGDTAETGPRGENNDKEDTCEGKGSRTKKSVR